MNDILTLKKQNLDSQTKLRVIQENRRSETLKIQRIQTSLAVVLRNNKSKKIKK